MDRQAVFDTVAKGLLEQNARSIGADDERCLFRGLDNRKCAVGFLILDNEYDPAMEKLPLEHVLSGPIAARLGADIRYEETHSSDLSFLYQLQAIHDRYQ